MIFVCASWEAQGWVRKGHSTAWHKVRGHLVLVSCLGGLSSTEDSVIPPHRCCPQSRTPSVPGQLLILVCCKQSEHLQTTYQFLLPCSKIKDISAEEEVGTPAGGLRGKKRWSSNSVVIILGSPALLSFYPKTVSLCCSTKNIKTAQFVHDSDTEKAWCALPLPELKMQGVIQSQGKEIHS